MGRLRNDIAIALTCLALIAPLAHGCGKERWPVKVARDASRNQIDPRPLSTTIAVLSQISAPGDPAARNDSRFLFTETTVFRVHAMLVLVRHEEDEDYHLVISDSRGRTMIIESPALDCVQGSRFTEQISQVRTDINRTLGPIHGTLHLHRAVTVTGVGFFDVIHGQTGVAPNGIELHPLLSISFH